MTVDEAAGIMTFTATLNQNVAGGFTLDVSTVTGGINGDATGGGTDFTNITNQQLTFTGTAGETQTFKVNINDDSIDESDEFFKVQMSNISNALVDITDDATGTITDDDTAPTTSNSVVVTNEDTTYVFEAGDFPFADADVGDSLNSVTITTLEDDGSLEFFDGTNWVAVNVSQTITKVDIDAGNLRFVPDADENDLTSAPHTRYTTFGFVVSDGTNTSSPATMTVNVNPVNDEPAGTDQTITTTEDVAYSFTPADFGFSDVEGDLFNEVVIEPLVGGSIGTLTFNGTEVTTTTTIAFADIGQLVYTPAQDEYGTGVASFDFQVVDDGGTANGGIDTDQSPNMITFDVTSQNDNFVDDDETLTVNEDSTLTGNVLTGTSSPDGPVSVTEFVVDGTTYSAGSTATISGIGTLTIDPNGSFTFIPEPNYNGPVPTATYTMTDGSGANETSTLSIDVRPKNDNFVDDDEALTVN